MKKALSLILVLVMLVCMATTAFADYPNVVGTHGKENSVDDGVTEDSFSASNPNATISITVNAGEVQHRYAVDVEYTDISLSISGGNLTWDVNKLEYVANDGGTGLEDTKSDVTVTNYSDLPVYITAAIDDKDANDGIDIKTCDADKNELTISNTEIAKAVPGQATTFSFVLSVSSSDWDNVATYYAAKLTTTDSKATAGTCTITISKSAT